MKILICNELNRLGKLTLALLDFKNLLQEGVIFSHKIIRRTEANWYCPRKEGYKAVFNLCLSRSDVKVIWKRGDQVCKTWHLPLQNRCLSCCYCQLPWGQNSGLDWQQLQTENNNTWADKLKICVRRMVLIFTSILLRNSSLKGTTATQKSLKRRVDVCFICNTYCLLGNIGTWDLCSCFLPDYDRSNLTEVRELFTSLKFVNWHLALHVRKVLAPSRWRHQLPGLTLGTAG